MAIQQTLVIFKPDMMDAAQGASQVAAQRLFTGRGFRPIQMKFAEPGSAAWEEHYGAHRGKGFFPPLIGFMTSGPSLFVSYEGEDAVAVIRDWLGATNINEAEAGTLRHTFRELSYGPMPGPSTLFHASESAEDAQREIALHFG